MKSKEESKNEFLSVAQAAEALGYSRQHVLRLINAGEIKAERIGKSFIIARRDLPGPFAPITATEKKAVDQSVDRVFRHYEEAIRKLGKE